MTALQIVRQFYPDVESVVDSGRNLTVEVTKKDTASKAVKDHKDCALAVACKRLPDVDGAVICVKTSYVIKGKKAYRYHNPESISREITAFDREAPFEPGVYELAKVPPTSKLGAKSGGHRPRTGNGTKPAYHRTENIRVVGH